MTRRRTQAEITFRKAHERIVDRLIGQVRGTFPQDRAAQDAVFPTTAARRASDEDGDDALPIPAAPPPATHPSTPA